MPEENDTHIHPMMNAKVIGSKGYHALDDTDRPNYIEQAQYLISNGYFIEDLYMSVSDLAEKLEKIADKNNKPDIE